MWQQKTKPNQTPPKKKKKKKTCASVTFALTGGEGKGGNQRKGEGDSAHQDIGLLKADAVIEIACGGRNHHVADIQHRLVAQQVHGGVDAFVEMLGDILEHRHQQQADLQPVQWLQHRNQQVGIAHPGDNQPRADDQADNQQPFFRADVIHEYRNDHVHHKFHAGLHGAEITKDRVALLHVVKKGHEVARELLFGDKHHPRHARHIQAERPEFTAAQQLINIAHGDFLLREDFTGVCGGCVDLQAQQHAQHDQRGDAAEDKVIRRGEVKQQAGERRGHRPAERAPHADLPELHAVQAAVAIGVGFTGRDACIPREA
ncbi:hypothetical protein BN132_3770 [Cronobacter turicensis 564]|nr:hypothetical protein BN132_3770 [Cronobacter turicensis 564]